jgi:predicted AlkP superfamily pyrophosphatase or phosphodiesterase
VINLNNSSLALINAILAYFKVPKHHESLKQLDVYFDKKPQNVVLLVLDGLGDAILKHFEPNGFLRNHQVATIDSVFPPTTVAAINTLESGLSPLEHGWLGWSLYFKEFERFIDIFPYQDSFTLEKIPVTSGSGKEILAYSDVYTQISQTGNAKCYVVHPKDIIKTGDNFETVYSQNFEETAKIVRELCKDDVPKYIYAYSPEPDFSLHINGTKSTVVGDVISEIEFVIKKYLSDVKDTLVIITADHGLIDIEEHIDISSIKELAELLEKPCFLEPRCTSYFIKSGKQEQFKKEFNRRFSDDFLLFEKNDPKLDSLFGSGQPHKKYNDFIGDFVSIAKANKTIIYRGNREKSSFLFKAHHAGITDEETKVPLIVISN